jgi:hypothetical protein
MITQPTTSYAMAFGMPLNEAIARLEASAAELRASAEKVTAQRNESSFGQLIAQAVKRRTRKKGNTEGEPESFGSKIKAAVERHRKSARRVR